MGYTPAPAPATAEADDNGAYGRKRSRGHDDSAPGRVRASKKQRLDPPVCLVASTTKTTTTPSKNQSKSKSKSSARAANNLKRALSPPSDEPSEPNEESSKRRRIQRDPVQTPRPPKFTAYPPSPAPSPVGKQHTVDVAYIESIRAGLQDIERRLRHLARLCEGEDERMQDSA